MTATIDKLSYDWWSQHSTRAVDPEILIVTIDNKSLEQLGRWPWPREDHATALQRIASGHPRCVVYDVLFSEPAPADPVLAHAISLAPVFLPLVVDSAAGSEHVGTAFLPVDELRTAAAGIGHINLEADKDGVVRRVALYEGNGQHMWPQLMLAVYSVIRDTHARSFHPILPVTNGSTARLLPPLIRSNQVLVPFSPHRASYPRVSFVDVLNGRVSPEIFRNRIVLVGATADGMDEHLTTSAGNPSGSTSGIEMNASVLDALLSHNFVTDATPSVTVCLSLLPIALLFVGFLFLTPSTSILLMPSLVALTFLSSGALLKILNVWVTPAPGMVTIILVYPLWNWRRLDVAMSFIGTELEQLEKEPQLSRNRRSTPASGAGRALERNMALMRDAARQLRDLKSFIWDSLDSLPDPVLVADPTGHILLANEPARRYLATTTLGRLEGESLEQLLGRLTFVRLVSADSDFVPSTAPRWPNMLDPSRFENITLMERGVEVRDERGQDFVLRYSRCTNARNELNGWIANLTDVTNLHAAQRQRDEMLHLLSHDMRSPQSSIVALIDIERPKINLTSVRLVYDRIERYARRTLALADSFVQLAAAETREYDLEIVNFADLLHAAIDEIWPIANAKHIEVTYDVVNDDYPVFADRAMIARALVNLLNNATKYSPPDTRVECVLKRAGTREQHLECVIRDYGYGIASDQKARLFERFQRLKVPGQPDSDGVGLGLTFVKTVVNRHGGTIQCDSAPGAGTAMTIKLPCVAITEYTGIDGESE